MSTQCSVASNCYAAKALLIKVSDYSTQAMYAWHVAKMRFLSLLSTKVLNSLEKIVAEKSLSWSGTTQLSHLPYQYTATLVVVQAG